jgi:hypothetical protein|tara:strand:+ start:3922 stop:4173 length:252 start_codon:yes stop_codon:yes gene_type:complete
LGRKLLSVIFVLLLCSIYLLEIADPVAAKVEQIRQFFKSIETCDPKPVLVVNEAKYIRHTPQTHEVSRKSGTNSAGAYNENLW